MNKDDEETNAYCIHTKETGGCADINILETTKNEVTRQLLEVRNTSPGTKYIVLSFAGSYIQAHNSLILDVRVSGNAWETFLCDFLKILKRKLLNF